MLNLTKGQSLDLSKQAAKPVTKVRVGAGWDVAEGKTVDLDLWIIPVGGSPVYFNNRSIAGVTLDKDDQTGGSSKDGADENVNIDVTALDKTEYSIVINIYDAVAKGQFFKDVSRAFIEVVDVETNTKLGEYAISENGGDNFTVVAGKLTKNADGGLVYTAHHQFSTKDISTVVTELGGQA